jgi:hypothetical protein
MPWTAGPSGNHGLRPAQQRLTGRAGVISLPSPIPYPSAWWDDCQGWVLVALEWVVDVEWPEGNENSGS